MTPDMQAGLFVMLLIAPLACLNWLAMMWVGFKMFGIKPKELLIDGINTGEAVVLAGYAGSTAYLVSSVFSRFI